LFIFLLAAASKLDQLRLTSLAFIITVTLSVLALTNYTPGECVTSVPTNTTASIYVMGEFTTPSPAQNTSWFSALIAGVVTVLGWSITQVLLKLGDLLPGMKKNSGAWYHTASALCAFLSLVFAALTQVKKICSSSIVIVMYVLEPLCLGIAVAFALAAGRGPFKRCCHWL